MGNTKNLYLSIAEERILLVQRWEIRNGLKRGWISNTECPTLSYLSEVHAPVGGQHANSPLTRLIIQTVVPAGYNAYDLLFRNLYTYYVHFQNWKSFIKKKTFSLHISEYVWNSLKCRTQLAFRSSSLKLYLVHGCYVFISLCSFIKKFFLRKNKNELCSGNVAAICGAVW